MPPLRWLNLISHSGGGSSSLSLYLAHRAEAASRECFLKLTERYCQIIGTYTDILVIPRYRMIWMIVRLEGSEQTLFVFLPHLLGRNNALWRRGAAPKR